MSLLMFGHPAASTIIVVVEGGADVVVDVGMVALHGSLMLLIRESQLLAHSSGRTKNRLHRLVFILRCNSPSNSSSNATSDYEGNDNQENRCDQPKDSSTLVWWLSGYLQSI